MEEQHELQADNEVQVADNLNGEGSNGAVKRQIGLVTATLIVIANMIGIGIFTSTGFLVAGLGCPIAILWAWVIGGVIALIGAFCFAELGTMIRRNGGEYRFLCNIYHPSVGFVSAWLSLIVGFSAPIAVAAMAFGKYLSGVFPSVPQLGAAVTLILVVAVLHSLNVKLGGGFQNIFTATKVVLIVVLIVAGLIAGANNFGYLTPPKASPTIPTIFSGAFAVGLFWIAFSYSGWNGAAYLAGEIRRPKRNIPLALLLGTGITTLLYFGLNLVFLLSAPMEVLAGQEDVGRIAAAHLFGPTVGNLVSGLICMALLSSVSVMMMIGPRVYEAVGDDHKTLQFLRRRKGEAPVLAIFLQTIIALAMVLTMTITELVNYVGFTLTVPLMLCVIGVYILRRCQPDAERPFRVPCYPVLATIFLGFSVWMLIYAIKLKPWVSLAGVGTIAVGLVIYWLLDLSDKERD